MQPILCGFREVFELWLIKFKYSLALIQSNKFNKWLGIKILN